MLFWQNVSILRIDKFIIMATIITIALVLVVADWLWGKFTGNHTCMVLVGILVVIGGVYLVMKLFEVSLLSSCAIWTVIGIIGKHTS